MVVGDNIFRNIFKFLCFLIGFIITFSHNSFVNFAIGNESVFEVVNSEFETENLILTQVDSFESKDSIRRTLAHFLMDYSSEELKLLDFDMPEKLETPEQALQVIDTHDKDAKKAISYAIQTKKIMTQPFVGCVTLAFYELPETDGKWLVGLEIFLDKQFQRQGIGFEALFELVNRLLDLENIEKIYYCCLDENLASKKLAEKVFNEVVEQRGAAIACSLSSRECEDHKDKKIFEALLMKQS